MNMKLRSKTVIGLVITALITLTIGCTEKSNKLNLSGTVSNTSSDKVYLKRYENKSFFTIDSTDIVNGSFRFNTETALPEIYGLSLDRSDDDPFNTFLVILDNNTISVQLDTTNNFDNTVVKGSVEHDLFLQLRAQRDRPINDIVKDHPSSIAALYIFYRYHSFRLTPEEINENIALLDPKFQDSEYVTTLINLAETLGKVEIGQKAPDFLALNSQGESENFSSYIGKGYLLLDFWASWCAPCRKENPNLVKAYEKYKEKNFEIVGVSLDSSEASWLKAVENDSLTWPQLIDKEAWAGNGVVNYGVRLIPSNFLIDENGVIVAKNIKGEDLHNTLNELLN